MAAPDPKTDQSAQGPSRSDLSTKSSADGGRTTPDAAIAAPDSTAPDASASTAAATKDDGSATATTATKGTKDKASAQASAKDKGPDSGGADALGDGTADGEQKVETVECPSCSASDKPAELVPYPDDGPNEFKRGTAFCEREGKRVRIDKAPDEEAALSVASSAAPTV